jgi:DNA-binding NtrC family response regulator
MPSLRIRVPDLDEPLYVSLASGRAVLVGRNPDPSRLSPSDLHVAPDALTVVRVPSQRVSANHLVLACSGETVWVRDLGSRNGSFVQLPARFPVQLPSDLELVVDLATLPPGDPRAQGLRMAEWTAERDFATAVALAIEEWFRRLSVRVHLQVRPRRPSVEEDEAEGDSFLLADDHELVLSLPTGSTHDLMWAGLLDQVQRYINEQNARFEQLQGHEDGFILASRAIREAHHQVAEAAARGMRLVLLGSTGSGKERLARCYHLHSRQQRGPYATVNCALLKENLLYAQLFGAKKGSFTGCVADIAGVVEAANEGTLFLDEIGEMDLAVQKALLRFLDSKGEYQRLGDPRLRRVAVQIVCATNVDLDDVQRRVGRFRDDLWYRLAVKVVRVPPLRERREDIIAYLRQTTLPGTSLKVYDALTPPALQLVVADPWPGNFRDLANFVDRLPGTTWPQSIDKAACAAALREGRRTGSHEMVRGEPEIPRPAQEGWSWQEVNEIAVSAFIKDHGAEPRSWGQVQLFTEKYLKPVFIARATGLAQLDELGKNINYSELARRLHIADGTTVKMHLQRYIDRFRRRTPDE